MERRFLLNVGILVLVAILIGEIVRFFELPSVRNVFAQATTISRESFTELYFDNFAELPKNANIGSQNLAFVIHNLENRDIVYTYDIYYEIFGKRFKVRQAEIKLANGEKKTINEKISPYSLSPLKVIVELDNKQDISFWIKEI